MKRVTLISDGTGRGTKVLNEEGVVISEGAFEITWTVNAEDQLAELTMKYRVARVGEAVALIGKDTLHVVKDGEG